MGTVHGVYLKYVGLSALSYAGYSMFMKRMDGSKISLLDLAGHSSRRLMNGLSANPALMSRYLNVPTWRFVPGLVLGYSAILNGAIAVMFKAEVGMSLLGKDRKTGQIPAWSYLVFFPFHLPTMLYTHLHTYVGKYKARDENGTIRYERVPVATEVQPGWWVGGCYGHLLGREWAGVIDLTVEFPESCIRNTRAYLSLPTWDGVPATPEQLEQAANFALMQKQLGGDILIHCAHGRGRSTTVMCACLVKAGLFPDWETALEEGIRPQRPVCKLNLRMRQALMAWQGEYVDKVCERKTQ